MLRPHVRIGNELRKYIKKIICQTVIVKLF